VVERTEHVMGMPVTATVRDPGFDPRALDAAFAELRAVDARFSTYRGDSEVSRLARGELAPERASPLVRDVLARCEALRKESGGAFDAYAGGALDPSGYVKGWALQRAAELIDACELCLDGGGDLVLRGGPWRVGIRHPLERDRLCSVLEIGGGAVATSATYERGEHILDPRTGRPPRGVLSVTVTGPELATADAYATAAFAMGAAGPAWTAGLDGYEAMTVLEGGRVLCTPGFSGRSPRASRRSSPAPAR
jgi:thiamine biosynthesis lipoprotein